MGLTLRNVDHPWLRQFDWVIHGPLGTTPTTSHCRFLRGPQDGHTHAPYVLEITRGPPTCSRPAARTDSILRVLAQPNSIVDLVQSWYGSLKDFSLISWRLGVTKF